MSSFPDSFTQPGDDSVPSTGSTRPFDDDGYQGYDPRLPSQRFDSFAATHFADSDSLKDSATDSPIFHNNNDASFSAGDDAVASQPVSEIYADEAIGEDFDGGFPGSDGPILPPPTEMEPEEGFALREWRRENAILLEEKEKREKEVLSQIIDEANEFKVDFYRRRKVTCEQNIVTNREKEKIFLANQEKFHAEADKNYWKAIAELVPNEVPAIEKKRGKKDQEKKPSVAIVQGPKPGKPTDLSRMRQIILKLKHNTPPHLKASPPAPAPAKDAKTSCTAVVTEAKAAAVVASPEAVAAA
ncbi:clathrin light chain 2-like [Quercus robur]|uniref:clathrin light chain 2-like n=1 Tax=Quercus robur TaxID=38942 RepID=UPI002163FED8|nr:clathrin light chain 2-like [Quercus robur]